jgi:hypothetical protein
MSKRASPIGAVDTALPAVQAALQQEIAARIVAGEVIGRIENGKVIASRSPTRDLNSKRRELLAQARLKNQGAAQHKSIA